jgi:cytoskeletal protein RodZ
MSDTQADSEAKKKEETAESLGSRLRTYREQNGHDIHEVAEALCLSPTIVNALEQEDFDALPEPPYVRGYLRSYAKFAEIEPQEIIDLYEAKRGVSPDNLEYHFKPTNNALAKPAVSASVVRLSLVALLLVSLAALSMIPAVNGWIGETWEGFSKQTAEKNYADAQKEPIAATRQYEIPAPLPGEKPDIVEPVTTKKATLLAENATNTTEDATAQQQNADKKSNSETNNDAEKSATKTTEENQQENNTTETGITDTEEGTKLKFVFKKEVWMRIKDKHKKTVFESISHAGDEKEIKLKKPMTFRIGNASNVEIYVDDKRLDISAFTKGSVANFAIE